MLNANAIKSPSVSSISKHPLSLLTSCRIGDCCLGGRRNERSARMCLKCDPILYPLSYGTGVTGRRAAGSELRRPVQSEVSRTGDVVTGVQPKLALHWHCRQTMLHDCRH
jgi:hypothetical protein